MHATQNKLLWFEEPKRSDERTMLHFFPPALTSEPVRISEGTFIARANTHAQDPYNETAASPCRKNI